MSIIRLLIVKSATADSEIDVTNLTASDLQVRRMESDALLASAELDVDVILLADNPAADVRALIRHLRNIATACKIIIKLHNSSSQAIAYLQAGVTGLLDSFPEAERLAEIIREIADGEYYLDQDIAQVLAMRQIKKMLEPFTALSSREYDIFCLLAEGWRLESIAAQLGVNSKTVSNCQTLIKLKLSLDSKQAIKNLAHSHGLIRDKRV